MKEVVEYIVRSLVTKKEAVAITEAEENGELIIQVRVAEEDMGKVIGHKGKIAQSIRTIVKSISSRQNKKVFVKFGDKE